MNRDQRRVFNLIATGTFIVFGTWVGTSLLLPDKSEASWWDDSWRYRQIVTATNNSPFTASDTPYRILMDTTSPIASGKMKADGGDIRVVDNEGKIVRFQVEQSTLNTTETGIWFDADIPADSSSTYYIYYGNTSATTPSFPTDIASNVSSGTTVTTNDGYEYTTTNSYGKVSVVKKDGTNLGIGGHQKNTTGYPGNWWDDRTFAKTQLASGPMFVEVEFEDTSYGNYSSFGTNVKMFKNGFVEEQVYLNYNNTGTDQLYYYLSFTSGTRNSVWVNASETLVDQAPNSGGLTRASLGHNWFGQRWTDTGNYGGTIISPNTTDWSSGQTSAQASYYQTNYSTSEPYATGSARMIRFGTFAGNGTVNEMHEKASLLGAQSTTLSAEENGPGPVLYFSFDEGQGTVANDKSASRKVGTLTHSTMWRNESDCIKGKCLYFDGSDTANNNTLTYTENSTSPTNLTGDVTISAWIRPTSNYFDSSEYVLRNGQGANQVYSLGYTPSAQRISMAWYDGAFKSVASLNNSVPLDTWSHVVVVRENNVVSFYVNGTFINSAAVTTPTVLSTQMSIGRTNNSGVPQDYTGFLDELKIYSFATTPEQIQQEYNSGGAVLGAKNSNLNNGLIGYWKLDEAPTATASATDSSGNGKTGTASNTLSTTGKFSYGRTFGGSDYISVPDNTIFTLGTNPVTIASWVKFTSSGLGIYQGIISQNVDSFELNKSSSNQLRLEMRYSDGTYKRAQETGASLTQADRWYHVAATFDPSTGAAVLYVDGVKKTTSYVDAQTSGSIKDSTSPVYIGSRTTNTLNLQGSLDETRIYKRLLTPSEIQQLYNFAPPPVAYYDFEENAGTSVNDRSGNGLTGTWVGSSEKWTTGKYGSAGNFDGSSNHVSTTGVDTSAGNFTLSAWIYPTVNNTSWKHIFGSEHTGYALGIDGSNYLKLTRVSLSDSPTSNYSPPLNTWTYVTVTYDDTTRATKYYANGSLVANVTYTGTTPNVGAKTRYIGRSTNYPSYFYGKIDEPKIYNYELTSSQIIEDMNAGHPIGGSPVSSQVGYWKLDEGTGTTANNSGNAGSAVNGTLLNNPIWSAGKSGKALTFDGTDDYVNMGNPTSLRISGSLTISAWIKTIETDTGGIVSKFYNTTGNRGYRFLSSNGNLILNISSDGTANASCSIAAGINNGAWHHVIAVFDAPSGTAKIYKNGTPIQTCTGFPNAIYNPSQNFNIGTSDAGTTGANTYSGQIDEVKIYNTALTSDQIKIDFNSGKSLKLGALGTEADGTPSNSSDRAYCPPGDTTATCGPIGEWKFDEMTGTTAKDTSGNGNNGTIVGEPAWQPNGKVGSALRFSGTNEYVNIGDLSSVEQATVTFTAWIKPASTNTDDDIITKGVHTQNQPLVIWRDDVVGAGSDAGNTDALSVIVYDGTTQHWFASPSNSLNDTNWHHITVAIVPGSYMKIYIDGMLVRTGTMTNTGIQNTAHNLRIGNDTNLGAADFDGLIDNVQVFNYELSPAQIAWNVNRGAPVAHYRLNECQGSSVHSSNKPHNPALDGIITIGATGTQTTAGTCQTAGTAWGNGASGKLNGSLSFDGTDDSIAIASFPNLPASHISVAAWVKIDAHKDWNSFVRHDWVGDGWLLYSNASGNIAFGIGQAGDQYTASKTNISTGDWHFVVGTYDGTTVKVYVDGAQGSTSSLSNATLDNAGDIYIGGQSSSLMDGQLDEVQIYNYALTPQQIKTVMNQGAIRFGP